jgi:hypothetical protein
MSNSTPKTPSLNDLFVAADEFADEELAAALHGRLVLKKGGEEVKLLGSLANAAAKKKLVACALARHVLFRTGAVEEQNVAAPTEWFAEQTQQKPKSVGEELSRLGKEGLMQRDENGWRVPRWALRKAINFIEESKNQE